MIAGTPQYMSPEQAHGDSIDHRSDLFSLGSLIYFMLTGHSPFRAETTMGVLNRICNDQPRSVRSINSDVPEWLEQIVTKLLAKPVEERFQSAGEVSSLLQDWHAHLQQPATAKRPLSLPMPPTKPSSLIESAEGSRGRFTKWLIATAAFAFFAIAGILIVLEKGKGTIQIETNSATDVPIRILRGEKVVDELVVSQQGATTRLLAGKYSIEVDAADTEVEIIGDKVTLERSGTWLAKITVRPQQDDPAVSKSKNASIQRENPKTVDNAHTPLNLLSTIEEVEAHIASIVKEREQITSYQADFSSHVWEDRADTTRHYRSWVDGDRKRSDCDSVVTDGPDRNYSRILTPGYKLYEDHLNKANSKVRHRDSETPVGWGDHLGNLIDVRKVGLVLRKPKSVCDHTFDEFLLPKSRSNVRVEKAQHDGQPITIVKMDAKSNVQIEYWLSPKQGNFPIYIENRWTDEGNVNQKYVVTQHTEWKRFDEIWAPSSVKHRYQCEYAGISDSCDFELASARFNVTPFPDVFNPLKIVELNKPKVASVSEILSSADLPKLSIVSTKGKVTVLDGADSRVWDAIGVMGKPADEDDLLLRQSDRKKVYKHGFQITKLKAGETPIPLQMDDVLIGIHRWQTCNASDIDSIIASKEFRSGDPVKFYVLRGKRLFRGYFLFEKSDGVAVDRNLSPPANAIAETKESPTDVVRQFLEAVRRGGADSAAETWLTQRAQTVLKEIGVPLKPLGTPNAKFDVTREEAVPGDENAVMVHSTWSEPHTDGASSQFQVVWALQKETAGWRISGLAMEIQPGAAPVILDFENGATMAQLLTGPAAQATNQTNSKTDKKVDAVGGRPITIGDTIAVHFPQIIPLAKRGVPAVAPPVTKLPSGEIVTGYPLVVASDGTLQLPLVPPIALKGLRVREAEQKIIETYVKKDILIPDKAFVALTVVPAAGNIETNQKIAAADTIAIYFPRILPNDPGAAPPVNKLDSGAVVTGYPVVVAENGTIKVPHIDPVNVDGLTVRQAEEKIAKTMVDKDILRPGRAHPILTLIPASSDAKVTDPTAVSSD